MTLISRDRFIAGMGLLVGGMLTCLLAYSDNDFLIALLMVVPIVAGIIVIGYSFPEASRQ